MATGCGFAAATIADDSTRDEAQPIVVAPFARVVNNGAAMEPTTSSQEHNMTWHSNNPSHPHDPNAAAPNGWAFSHEDGSYTRQWQVQVEDGDIDPLQRRNGGATVEADSDVITVGENTLHTVKIPIPALAAYLATLDDSDNEDFCLDDFIDQLNRARNALPWR